MLPRELSDESVSLCPNVTRPVVACRMVTLRDGSMEKEISFFVATIESKAKLAYDNVSDWLEEEKGEWQPPSDAIAKQIRLLERVCLSRARTGAARTRWCLKIALITASC